MATQYQSGQAAAGAPGGDGEDGRDPNFFRRGLGHGHYGGIKKTHRGGRHFKRCLHCDQIGHKWVDCYQQCIHCGTRNHCAIPGKQTSDRCPVLQARPGDPYRRMEERVSQGQIETRERERVQGQYAKSLERAGAHIVASLERAEGLQEALDSTRQLLVSTTRERNRIEQERRTMEQRLEALEQLLVPGGQAIRSRSPSLPPRRQEPSMPLPRNNRTSVNTGADGRSDDDENASYDDSGRTRQNQPPRRQQQQYHHQNNQRGNGQRRRDNSRGAGRGRGRGGNQNGAGRR